MSTESRSNRFRDCCCILDVTGDSDVPPPPTSRSVDLKVKLPITDTISRFYAPQRNRKAIRVLTVAVYILCVSMAAIILSIYYIFVWDPDMQSTKPSNRNCDKVVIPEFIAIRLVNSTEITVDQFYKNLAEFYHQFVHNKTDASYVKNKTPSTHELQQPPSSHNYRSRKHKTYSRVAIIETTSPPIIITTTRTLSTLPNYQRKYLKRTNEEDEDIDENAEKYQDFDDREQYLDTQSTDNIYTDENYETTNYGTYK